VLEQIRTLIKDKKVLILGFGKEGRSTYAYLQKAGGWAKLGVADQNPVALEGQGVELVCGEEYQSAIDDYDVVFKSPGIVLERQDAKTLGKITSQTEQFMRRFGAQTVGITGTKGKSTTASVLYHILHSDAQDSMLVGNIGVPALDMADRVGPNTRVVYELSCHQLEYTNYSPHIAVLLNLFPEHLDHYGTYEKYAAAKQNIYRHQQPGDLLICNQRDIPEAGNCPAKVCTVSFEDASADVYVTENNQIRMSDKMLDFSQGLPHLVGRHNIYNVGVAYVASRALNISEGMFLKAVQSYQSLPHRLEFLGEKDGVRYYDDSISTIPETAIQALQALSGVGTLILGGMDRGISYEPLLDFLADYPLESLVFLPATGHTMYETIRQTRAQAFAGKTLVCAEDLQDATRQAKRLTKPGGICLLSPAAASYGFFKNFEQRGEYFKKYVFETEK